MKTVNLELSKALKEAGYPQETEFCYYRNAETYHFLRNPMGGKMLPMKEKTFASPTADEILDQLPDYNERKDHLVLYKDDRPESVKWELSYDGNNPTFSDDSLANACARMWLYLKKEGLL